MNEETAIERTQPSDFPIAGVILAIAGFVLLVMVLWLFKSGQNYQEIYNVTRGSTAVNFGNVSALVSPDNPMPIYYLLSGALSHWFTPTIILWRLWSFVFYALSLPMAYLVGREAADDRRVGLLAAAIIGLSPFFIWYSSRATVYSLVVLAVLINQYFYIGILHKRKWAWLGYVLSGLFGLGVHYFFALVLLMQMIFYAVKHRQFPRHIAHLVFLCGLVFAVALGLWINYSAAHGAAWNYLPYTSQPSATNAFIIYVQFLFGFQSVEATTFVISLWPLLVILALLAVQKYVKPPVAVQYFSFAAFGPVLLMFALSWLWRPLFLSSYFIICLPAFLLIVSWYLVVFELRALTITRYILLGAMIVMLFAEVFNTKRALSEDYLGLAPYQPASSAKVSAYDGHQVPAAGPPLQVPSDSPGVLTHK